MDDELIEIVFRVGWDSRRGPLRGYMRKNRQWYRVLVHREHRLVEIWDDHPDCGDRGRSIFSAELIDQTIKFSYAKIFSPFLRFDAVAANDWLLIETIVKRRLA